MSGGIGHRRSKVQTVQRQRAATSGHIAPSNRFRVKHRQVSLLYVISKYDDRLRVIHRTNRQAFGRVIAQHTLRSSRSEVAGRSLVGDFDDVVGLDLRHRFFEFPERPVSLMDSQHTDGPSRHTRQLFRCEIAR